ncbi:MAG: hypothetical protein A2431_00675 [Candidatus Zambryskibacteria bacterium RIFOXYC1_FULL_39_10]|uniref:DUF559 domain-containing protein n=1 Tax=Candidatus Zambryskibacteria bacterium RIFOXYC1_FULL_39_10 TaxID=1802779 RepID=A0A1G2V212_9BACT|nr:MAG: hypothetical protein A2431_00675 [Candidatus Zambryskibacteria bacterium RIFOXYC1_FULL_39_10]OHB16558.1 MAG: hypothetical protein A2605_03665 [Candidatus Zambryskibacteria bacterium RIFOXYD1_FULL_39_35]
MSKIHNNRILKERRMELRRKETPSEEKLWFYLRDNKLGVKFKRQHSIGGYILDFYCAEKKLIVELDGEIHNTKEAREDDEVRDKFFKGLGYKTVRFLNREVENNIENILIKIKQNILLFDALHNLCYFAYRGEIVMESNILVAPKGKFRVVEINEGEPRERRSPTIIRDCNSREEAVDIMKRSRGLNFERSIYDENGQRVRNFRESKAENYRRYLNEGFGVYPWGEAREND